MSKKVQNKPGAKALEAKAPILALPNQDTERAKELKRLRKAELAAEQREAANRVKIADADVLKVETDLAALKAASLAEQEKEEAERKEREAAERVRLEEAERNRLAKERRKQEAEAARVAAEAEAARVAAAAKREQEEDAATEAARIANAEQSNREMVRKGLAQQEENIRRAAASAKRKQEEEAARVEAARVEAARIAAEAEKARIAAEAAKVAEAEKARITEAAKVAEAEKARIAEAARVAGAEAAKAAATFVSTAPKKVASVLAPATASLVAPTPVPVAASASSVSKTITQQLKEAYEKFRTLASTIVRATEPSKIDHLFVRPKKVWTRESNNDFKRIQGKTNEFCKIDSNKNVCDMILKVIRAPSEDGIANAISSLRAPNMPENVINQVNNMAAEEVIALIRALGVKVVSSKGKNSYETYSQWIGRVQATPSSFGLDTPALTAFIDNKNLHHMIRILLEFAHINPALLNKYTSVAIQSTSEPKYVFASQKAGSIDDIINSLKPSRFSNQKGGSTTAEIEARLANPLKLYSNRLRN
jgi:hypothetical protein